MKFQGRSKRTKTGGRVRRHRKKRKSDLGREAAETTVGEPRFRVMDSRGRTEKVRALSTNVANVTVDGETRHEGITDVVENPSNPNYARRNIITKGALIELEGGETARVTSRPGQTGQVNAVLVE